MSRSSVATGAWLPTVDLFSGAGGLSLGLAKAGFASVFASDWDRYACETYRVNIATHVEVADAQSLTAEHISSVSGVERGEFALVCGGPPCQGFSMQRRGNRDDPRNDMIVVFAKLAVALSPTFVLVENVPGLLGARGKSELQNLYAILERAGYAHAHRVLDAADFGVPQHRRRAIIVAWRRDRIIEYAFPVPTHSERTWLTVRDGIGNLPEPPADLSEHPAYRNHRRVRITAVNEQRISHVPRGGGRADIPFDLQLQCHRKDNGHRHLDVFGRMEWEKPAPTITAMFDNFTRGRFAHPELHRSITGREGARLQSFPDDFAFVGPKKDVARQIGNAVPPNLALEIGRSLRAALDGVDRGIVDSQLRLRLSASKERRS